MTIWSHHGNQGDTLGEGFHSMRTSDAVHRPIVCTRLWWHIERKAQKCAQSEQSQTVANGCSVSERVCATECVGVLG
eukprot:m.162591 g.162591  ORF g.162591 m.162591 type:complete len:77 (+) comp14378_c0_seq3:3832-4062(+)